MSAAIKLYLAEVDTTCTRVADAAVGRMETRGSSGGVRAAEEVVCGYGRGVKPSPP
jgi:hypothetical protein